VGLPLHVWEEESFKQLGGIYGSFLDFDEDTIGFKRLDFARILVNTSRMGLIDEHLKLEVMGASYDVWVVEEQVLVVSGKIVESQELEVASSMSSHNGCMREQPELLEVGDEGCEASPRGCSVEHLERLGESREPNQHLILQRPMRISEVEVSVGQDMLPAIPKPFSNGPVVTRQVASAEASPVKLLQSGEQGRDCHFLLV
jgi:hypothetical protein